MYTISRAHQSSSVSSPSAHVEIENLICPRTLSQEGVEPAGPQSWPAHSLLHLVLQGLKVAEVKD